MLLEGIGVPGEFGTRGCLVMANVMKISTAATEITGGHSILCPQHQQAFL